MWTRAPLTLILAGCFVIFGRDQNSVSVVDSNSRKAIAGAVVSISRGGETVAEAESDSQGKAAFSELQPGPYWIRIEKPGWVDLLDICGRGRQTAIAPATQSIEIALI